MDQALAKQVIAVIAKTQHLDASKVTLDSSFEELGVDSLDGVNILFALENELDIQIPDDAAKQIRSVRQTVEGVEKLVAQKTAGAAETGG
ncbi:MAG TPA: phosphopantetheine-binding protein [Bryobacterales bacterium]|nr:phosphopantetheine-binding protein [Bryobacterales bacterium]